MLTMLKTFCKFIRVTWPAVILIVASALILAFLGIAGDLAFHHWHLGLGKEFEGKPLPVWTQWLDNNYGMNEFDLISTHFCFFWVLCIVFVISTYAPQQRFRQSFLISFLLVWFLILAFWAFLAASAALPFVTLLRAWPRPPAIMPTLNTIFHYALPVLLVLLIVLRVAKGWRNRSSRIRGGAS